MKWGTWARKKFLYLRAHQILVIMHIIVEAKGARLCRCYCARERSYSRAGQDEIRRVWRHENEWDGWVVEWWWWTRRAQFQFAAHLPTSSSPCQDSQWLDYYVVSAFRRPPCGLTSNEWIEILTNTLIFHFFYYFLYCGSLARSFVLFRSSQKC